MSRPGHGEAIAGAGMIAELLAVARPGTETGADDDQLERYRHLPLCRRTPNLGFG